MRGRERGREREFRGLWSEECLGLGLGFRAYGLAA